MNFAIMSSPFVAAINGNTEQKCDNKENSVRWHYHLQLSYISSSSIYIKKKSETVLIEENII